jgi:ribonuclease III
MKKLMQKLGYEFRAVSLVDTALTHRSAGPKNNERMEFLGDALLGFIIATQLFHQYPHADEGELSRLRANLVNENVLAEIAIEFGLGDYLRLGSGELKSGGARRKSILADAVEALIGAVYLDADIVTCQSVILKWFDSRLNNPEAMENLKDPKSLLQEYLQAKKYSLPEYHLISTTGDAHSQHFHVSCEVAGLKHRTEGVGSTRRGAEQMAAQEYFTWLLEKTKKKS